MRVLTHEEKQQLLATKDADTFFELCREIYSNVPPVPINQMDLEVLQHMDKLCKKRGKERGENIHVPSDPREAFQKKSRKR